MSYDIHRFSFDSERNMLVTEASMLDLRHVPAELEITGNATQRFVFAEQRYDAQGDDTIAWVYRAVDPKLRGMTAHILND